MKAIYTRRKGKRLMDGSDEGHESESVCHVL